MKRTVPSISAGFTLLEVVIVVGIFTVMMLALMNFFLKYNSTYVYEQAVVKTASSAGAVVNEVVASGLSGDQILAFRTFSGTSFTSGTSTVVFEEPSVDTSGIIVAGKYDYVVIYASGASVYRKLEANAASGRHSGTKLLTDSLGSLTFTYDSSSFPLVTKVNVDVLTQVLVKGQPVTSELHQQVYLRNTQ